MSFLLQIDVTLATSRIGGKKTIFKNFTGRTLSWLHYMSTKLIESLKKGDEIHLMVKGRVTGNETSRPVWIVLKDRQVLLVPVNGTKTRKIVKNPQVKIDIAGESYRGMAQPIKNEQEISWLGFSKKSMEKRTSRSTIQDSTQHQESLLPSKPLTIPQRSAFPSNFSRVKQCCKIER